MTGARLYVCIICGAKSASSSSGLCHKPCAHRKSMDAVRTVGRAWTCFSRRSRGVEATKQDVSMRLRLCPSSHSRSCENSWWALRGCVWQLPLVPGDVQGGQELNLCPHAAITPLLRPSCAPPSPDRERASPGGLVRGVDCHGRVQLPLPLMQKTRGGHGDGDGDGGGDGGGGGDGNGNGPMAVAVGCLSAQSRRQQLVNLELVQRLRELIEAETRGVGVRTALPRTHGLS